MTTSFTGFSLFDDEPTNRSCCPEDPDDCFCYICEFIRDTAIDYEEEFYNMWADDMTRAFYERWAYEQTLNAVHSISM